MAIIRKEDIIQPAIFNEYIAEVKAAKQSTDELVKALNLLLQSSQKKLSVADSSSLKAIQETLAEINKVNKAITEKQNLEKKSAELGSKLTDLEKQKQKAEQDRLKALQKLKQARTEEARDLSRIRLLTQKQNQANKTQAKLNSKLTSTYEKLSIKLNENRKRYKDLAVQNRENTKEGRALLNNINQLDSKLKKVDATVGQFQRSVGNYGKATEKLGQRLGGLNSAFGVTLGLFGSVSLFKKATKTIKDFEKANAVLAGVLGTNLEGVKALTDEAKRLGSTTVKSASEVTALQESLARLGFAQKDIINLTPALIDGSIALNSDLAQTADLVGSVVKTFDNLGTGDATDIVDQLTLATQKSALSFEKLNTALPIVGGAANALGIPLEESLSLLGKLSDAGIDASSSASALRNIFLKAAEEGVPYTDLLEDITSSQGKLATANKLFGKRGAVVATTLAKNAKGAKELQKQLENAGGTAASVAETQLNTLDGAVKGLESAWEGFILSLNSGGGVISNVLVGIVKFFTENIVLLGTVLFSAAAGFVAFKVVQVAASAVSSIYNGVLALQKNILKTLRKENTLGIIIEKAVIGVRTVLAAITGSVAAKTKIATVAQKAFNKVLKANPIGLVITAIAALVGAMKLLEDSYESITEANNEFITSQRIGREEIFADIDALKKANKQREIELKKKIALGKASNEDLLKLQEKAQKDQETLLQESVKKQEDIIENSIINIAGIRSELNKAQEEQQKRLNEGFGDAISEGVSNFAGALDDSTDNVAELNNKVEKLKKALQDASEELGINQKALKDLEGQTIETAEAIAETDVAATQKSAKAAKEARISALNDIIARIKLQLLAVEKGSEKELELKKKLEDAKLDLTLETNSKATKNQRKLLKEENKIAKEELQDLFDESLFEKQVNIIQVNFNKITQILKLQLANDLLTQSEYNNKSIDLEVERLEKLIKIREIEGKDVTEQNVKIAELRQKQRQAEVNETLKGLTDKAQKEKELEDTFFTKREIALKERAIKEKDLRKNIDDILLDEQIAALEQEQVLIKQSGKERLEAQEQAFKKSKEQGEEFKSENEKLNKEDAARQLEIQKQLAELKLEQQVSDEEKLLLAKKEFLAATVDLADAAAQIEIDRLEKTKERIDEEIAVRKNRVDELQKLASKENTNAAESVAFEERRIAELERKKEKQAVKQKLIELTLSALKTYQSEIESGKKPARALGDTFKNITLLTNFAKGLQSFEVGTERTRPNENVDGRGGFRAILHPDERVLTKQQNKPLLDAGISNEELPDLALMAKQGLTKSSLVVSQSGNLEQKEVVKEIKGLRGDINKLERVKDVSFDKKTEVITQVIQSVNAKEKRHQKLRNKW